MPGFLEVDVSTYNRGLPNLPKSVRVIPGPCDSEHPSISRSHLHDVIVGK